MSTKARDAMRRLGEDLTAHVLVILSGAAMLSSTEKSDIRVVGDGVPLQVALFPDGRLRSRPRAEHVVLLKTVVKDHA